jgi:hypothetical protein
MDSKPSNHAAVMASCVLSVDVGLTSPELTVEQDLVSMVEKGKNEK